MRDNTIPIIGQVWIDYPEDPSLPWHWSIYNARTGELLDDVAGMQISVKIHERTTVDVRRMNMQGIERYELVACPPKGPAPVAAKACDECNGSGYYASPVTGKRSPCSRGCKHP